MALIAYETQPEMPSLLPFDDNAVGLTGQTLRKLLAEDLENRLRSSISNLEKLRLLRAKQQVCILTKLEPNWDSYGAPAPNELAVTNTIRVLELLQPYELGFARPIPSAEGGIGICFVNGDRYADLECSNEGEIIGVRYVGAEMPTLIEVDETEESIKAAVEQIRNHLGA